MAMTTEARAKTVCVSADHPAHNGPCGRWIDNGWTRHGCHCEGHRPDVQTTADLAPWEEAIAGMAADGWDQDPDTGRFDWDGFLYRVEKGLDINLPADMTDPVIRRVQRVARDAAREARL